MTGDSPKTAATGAATHPPGARDGTRPARLPWALGLLSDQMYRRLWAGGVLSSLGTWAARLAISWLVLVQTDSVLATASTMAASSAPGIFVAPFSGAAADRFPRQKVLAVATAANAGAVVAVGLVAVGGIASAWSVLPLVAIIGVANSFAIPSTHALTTDVVGQQRAMQGLSLYSTGARAVGVVGGLVAGVLSDHAGPPVALFASAAVLGIAATVMLTVSATRRSERRMKEKFLHQTLGGLRAMSTNPAVATLLVMAIVVEIFGFAYQAVLPSVARDVLHVKATGYGSLTFMAGVGAMAGVAGLTLLGNYPRKSRLVLLIVFGFGVSMLAFSASTSLPLSLVLILGIGAAMGMFDTMQWTLLQANVADEMRGRAVAAWVFAIGFGWIGHLLLGALADGAGVRWALAGSGVMLIATGVAAIYVFRRVRIE